MAMPHLAAAASIFDLSIIGNLSTLSIMSPEKASFIARYCRHNKASLFKSRFGYFAGRACAYYFRLGKDVFYF
nr:hypothetical protein [Treponema phagedenis]